MAAVPKAPLLDASITIDATDLSNVSNRVQIEDSGAEHDVTGFQGGGYTEETRGLKTAVINITFFQDYTTGSVHETLKPLYDSGETFDVVIKPDEGPTARDNPAWTMTARLFSYNPVDAEVGQPQSIECAFRNASSRGLTEDDGTGS
jgi:hypothetical protein